MSSHCAQTVMVVDDNDGIREVLRAELEILGYRVVEAINGQDAVDCAGKECPDLILMDISMPVLDGLSATRLIRETDKVRNVAIVALSALYSGGTRQNALAAGCDEFVRKPIDFDQLTALINRHLPANQ